MTVLKNFGKLDCSFLPEYHLAYCSTDKTSRALMFVFEVSDNMLPIHLFYLKCQETLAMVEINYVIFHRFMGILGI